jgi:hypothetical protein
VAVWLCNLKTQREGWDSPWNLKVGPKNNNHVTSFMDCPKSIKLVKIVENGSKQKCRMSVCMCVICLFHNFTYFTRDYLNYLQTFTSCGNP